MGCVLGVFAKGQPHASAVFRTSISRLLRADVPADYLRAAMGFFSFSCCPPRIDRLLDCRFGRAMIAPLWGGIPAHKLRGWQMSDPELVAKSTPEINKIQRQRNAQGLPALTAEQTNRLRTVINTRHAVLHRMRAGRQRTESHWVPSDRATRHETRGLHLMFSPQTGLPSAQGTRRGGGHKGCLHLRNAPADLNLLPAAESGQDRLPEGSRNADRP
jgi:hypothetical protein